jgi:UDP-N-acetylglucosamine:LPS N-acetylglucosamine transferase
MLSDPSSLYNPVTTLLNNPEKRAELSKNLQALTPNRNAARALAGLLKEIAI